MNPIQIVGYVLVIGMILGAIMIDTPLAFFTDIPSLMIVVGGSFAFILIAGGADAMRFPWGKQLRYLWAALILALIFMAVSGDFIGHVKMMQNLSEPSTIGPSMAVALLTSLYGMVLIAVVAAPQLDRYIVETEEYDEWHLSRYASIAFPFVALFIWLNSFFILMFALSSSNLIK